MRGCQWEVEIERELRGPLGNANGPVLQSYHSNSGPATTPAAENCGTVVLFGGMYVEWHQVRTSSTVVGCGAAADEVGAGGAREEERASRAAGAFPKTGIAVVREEFYGLHPGFRVATVVRGNDRSGVLRLLCGRGCERLMFENCCRGLD